VGFCAQDRVSQIEPLLITSPLQHILVVAYSDYLRATTDLDLPESVSAPRRSFDKPGMLMWNEVLTDAPAPLEHRSQADDWCVIPYSSGTTGRPKGCLHNHRSVNFLMAAYAAWFQITQDSVLLTSLPLFHVTGMQNSMNLPIYTGSTMVLMTRWDRRVAAKLIERYRVTHWRSITMMANDFLSDPDLGDTDLSSLKGIGGGGAQMPKALAEKLEAQTGLKFVEGYGLTEAVSVTHINPPDAAKSQCLGIPFFNVDSRIIDPRNLLELDANQVGEIVINGPQVFQGYWKNQQATAVAFIEIDGKAFLRTGDLGYYDEEGYFFMVDRLKRMINASGFKVWPAEVEAMMHEHPGIQEVCIIAAPDMKRGETVKAVIVAKHNVKSLCAEDIQKWCREHMSAYKVPEIIEFTDALPHTGSGKVRWRLLQEGEKSLAGNTQHQDSQPI
jgi:fatty-acyl-CoA synthase